MKPIDTTHLLQQIRTLGQDLQVPASPPSTSAMADGEFGTLLKTTLHAVNEAQAHSRELKTGFLAGSDEHSLAEVMIASQKASLGFRAVTEVRNKLITAYQDIMNMPV